MLNQRPYKRYAYRYCFLNTSPRILQSMKRDYDILLSINAISPIPGLF